MKRSFWLSLLAYLVPTFVLGYAWHLVIFQERYAALDLYRAEVIIPFGLTSMLLQGIIFSWAYPRLVGAGDSWVTGAARFALIFGTLAWTFTTLPVAAKYRMTSVSAFMALETAFTVLQFLVVSPLIALAQRNVARAGDVRLSREQVA